MLGDNRRWYIKLCPAAVILLGILACHSPLAPGGAISEEIDTPSSSTFPQSQAGVSAGVVSPGPQGRGCTWCNKTRVDNGSLDQPSQQEVECYWRGFGHYISCIREEGCLLQN